MPVGATSGNAVVSTSSRPGNSSNSPRFLGRVPFPGWRYGIVLVCLRLPVHFPLTLRSTLHMLLLGQLIILFALVESSKADLVDLARTFLKPVRAPKVLDAVVDFGDLPSDSEHSDSFTCELESLN